MTDQLTLGEHLKQAGMARADEAEPNEWKARADQAIVHLAQLGHPFSAEDVRAICGDPEHVNAFGSRLAYAAKRGIIRPFGFEEATRPSRHRAVLRIWIGA